MGNAYNSPLKRWDICSGMLQECKGKVFVEVGVKEGRLCSTLLKNLPDVRVIAIDPWAPMPNCLEDYESWDFEQIEREFWKNIGEHKTRCEMLRMTSEQAWNWHAQGRHWHDCAINTGEACNCDMMDPDVVFIDAGHDYDSVLADIKAWWPIVKHGGYLAGHDFNHKWPSVMRAVAEVFPLTQVIVFPDSVWAVQKEREAGAA